MGVDVCRATFVQILSIQTVLSSSRAVDRRLNSINNDGSCTTTNQLAGDKNVVNEYCGNRSWRTSDKFRPSGSWWDLCAVRRLVRVVLFWRRTRFCRTREPPFCFSLLSATFVSNVCFVVKSPRRCVLNGCACVSFPWFVKWTVATIHLGVLLTNSFAYRPVGILRAAKRRCKVPSTGREARQRTHTRT